MVCLLYSFVCSFFGLFLYGQRSDFMAVFHVIDSVYVFFLLKRNRFCRGGSSTNGGDAIWGLQCVHPWRGIIFCGWFGFSGLPRVDLVSFCETAEICVQFVLMFLYYAEINM